MTRCEGPPAHDRGESWDDCRTLDEEEVEVAVDDVVATSYQKLVIMKNTQIDIEFEAADATAPPPSGK